jgi:hypothetical protein
MLYATDKRVILEVLRKVEDPSFELQRAIREFEAEMVFADSPGRGLPFHLGGCNCPPGACQRRR